MSISVSRPINGISINGLEYLLDDDGNIRLFSDENEAKDWLTCQGFSMDEIDWMTFKTE
ncbi:hypothetical protein [Acinetobacter bereziniae]|uniref:hypothetical protein n=1 Tax=Acinetobacter bereziniae TaxID=106648 RepID=UPI000A98A2E2|nr:hypothetical protein [Acinetobacter bereziniae]